MRLVVSSLADAMTAAARHRPDAAISILGPGHSPPDFGALPRLHLVFNDIGTETDGLRAAAAGDLEALLGFARARPGDATVLIHCWMGVSRSPAAALILACALNPGMEAVRAAAMLRRLSPKATPNPRMIALADSALNLEGRLITAVRDIGRGADASSVTPFIWIVGATAAQPQS